MKKITYLFVYFFFIISMSVCETPPGSPTYATTSTTSLTTKKTILSRIGISEIPNSSRELLNAFMKLLLEFAEVEKEKEKEKAELQKENAILKNEKEKDKELFEKDKAILKNEKEKDMAILKNEKEKDMELFEKDKAILKNEKEKDMAILKIEKEKDMEILMEKLEEKKKDYIKLCSLALCRSWIDNAEKSMLIHFTFPNKDGILGNLRNPNPKKPPLINATEQLGSFDSYTNIHTLRWLYYLMYCKSAAADMMRNALNANNISVSDFCNGVGLLHEQISSNIHEQSCKLTTVEIIEGLRLARIMKPKSIYGYVQVLEEIRGGPLLFKGNFTTVI